MKTLTILLLSFFFAAHSTAQNIVPNSNFSIYINCPTGLGALPSCKYWYFPTGGSTDYFHACYDALMPGTTGVGVPDNLPGSQVSSSSAYLGIIVLHPTSNYREYAGVPIPALTPGAAYRVLIKLSLGDVAYWATEAPGVFFFKDMPLFTPTSSVLPHIPQVEFSYAGHITDKTNWVTVTDTFIAADAYTNMMIGNFRDDASSTKTVFPGGGAPNNYSYYYIDSVAVEKIADPIFVTDVSHSVQVRLSPNPVTEKAVLQIHNLPLGRKGTLSITNMQGQAVCIMEGVGLGTTPISLAGLAAGVYYCRLHVGSGIVWQDKMIVGYK